MLEFDDQGLLPTGIHDCDETAFRALLVQGFPDSTTRAIIAAGFQLLRSDAVVRGCAGIQWLDGSYVTNKTDPDDIDLVTFIEYNHLQSLQGTPAEAFISDALAAGPGTPAQYRSDAYVVAVVPAGHPLHVNFKKAHDYWVRWFGHMRTLLGPDGEPLPARPKGLLSMGLGDAALHPQIAVGGGLVV